MTPDTLEERVLTLDQSIDLAAAFAGLDEKQRAKLSSHAQKLHKQLSESKAGADASDRLRQYLALRKGDGWSHWNSQPNRNAALAIFAVGPLSAVKKWQVRATGDDAKALRKIIRDRRPDWLEEWIEHEFNQEWTTIEFPTIHAWVREGVCAKPTADGYFRLFANHLMRTGFYGRKEDYIPPLSEQLLRDPELLADVDGLFRVETNAFNTNAWLTKGAPEHYETWTQALLKLSKEGHLERAHLLRLALDGLRLDIKQNQLSGYHRFYRAMEPSPAEIVAHQPDYVELLCHPVSHVAKFAIDMLAKVEKANALQLGPFLREIGTVFASETKGNALAALKLVQRIVARGKKSPDPAALAALIEALRHADAEVQAKALELLEPHARHLSADQLSELEDMLALLSASNRPSLQRLVGSERREGAKARAPASSSKAEVDLDYRPLASSEGCRGVLSADNAITPIASVDELIERVFHAIEVVDTPDELERIIDAMSRLADNLPADFDRRVAPLLQRLSKGQTGQNGLGAGHIGVGRTVIDLIKSWAEGRERQTAESAPKYHSREDAYAPMRAHLRAIARRVSMRNARIVLAAPTHSGGWIDPLVWVERLNVLAGVPHLPASMDLRLSMLRLAPDNRKEALGQAETLNGEIGRLARFALGGSERPEKSDRRNYAAWITAARSREPDADWSSAFAGMTLDDVLPDSLRPAVHEWTATHESGGQGQFKWKRPILKIATHCAEGGASERSGLLAAAMGMLGARIKTDWAEIPSAALCRRMETKHYWSSDLNITWLAQWLAYIWPQKLDSAHMKAAGKFVERVDDDSSNWTPNHGFLNALFQRGRPWGEAGHLVLALGLIGKDADVRGLAIDALIEGIEGRMFDPEIFASEMARLCSGEWVKFNRLGENLLQVVQVSPLHARAIGLALQAWLPDFDLQQRNSYYVLQVMVEAQASAGSPVTPAVREALGRLSGTGKAAMLAKQLLA